MPTFQASDGITLSYQRWGEDTARPMVLLHHGFIADSRTNWVGPGVVGALVAAGRGVAAIDARGHGESGKPHDPAFYGESRMAEDLITLADLLVGPADYDLVGYSMGAIVSLITATRDPRVRRLVVGGVGSGVVELGGVDTRAVGKPAIREALLSDDPASISPAAAGFRALVDAVRGDRVALAAQAEVLHDTPIALDTITAPTLVLPGREDHLAVRPEVLAAAIPGATLKIVAGDHLYAVRQPEFHAAIIDFLNMID
jgi:pimeloyl-ACP methyl ester carboxylesterase